MTEPHMAERLEVTPGSGTVLRFGATVAWLGPTASTGLIAYLVHGAETSAGSPTGGRQLADQIAAILRASDPEPSAPFVIVGAGEGGWGALLHGPVQLFDGVRWATPTPGSGWVGVLLGYPQAIVVGPTGAAVIPMRPDSPYHLERGVVPGSGFTFAPGPLPPIVPAAGAAASAATAADVTPGGGTPGGVTPGGEAAPAPEAVVPPTEAPAEEPASASPSMIVEPAVPEPAVAESAVPEPVVPEPAVPEAVGVAPDLPTPEASPAPTLGPVVLPPQSGAGGKPPTAAIDLRHVPGRPNATALRPVAEPEPRPAGVPVVNGVNCPRGHFNHPATRNCLRCGMPIAEADRHQVSGPARRSG